MLDDGSLEHPAAPAYRGPSARCRAWPLSVTLTGGYQTQGVPMFEFPPFDDPWWQTCDAQILWDLYGPGN